MARSFLATWPLLSLPFAVASGCVHPTLDDPPASDPPTAAARQAITTCATPVTYADSVHIGSMPACGATYASWPIDDCYNTQAPPLPSILRNYVSPVNPTSANPNEPFVLPVFRTSNDGRLTLLDGPPGVLRPAFGLFLPENGDHDLMPNVDPARRAVSAGTYEIHPYHLFNPLDTRLAVSAESVKVSGSWWTRVKHMPPMTHANFCDDSAAGFVAGGPPQLTSRRNPRPCSAPFRTGATPLEGDCYDVTLQANIAACDNPVWSVFAPECTGRTWEIRTSDLTVFVPRSKQIDAGQWSLTGVAHPEKYPVWVYPRQPPTVSLLPAYDGDGTADDSYDPHKTHWLDDYGQAQRCYAGGVPPTHAAGAPRWCELLWNQRHTPHHGFQIDADGDAHDDPASWDGSDSGGLALFEPATTGDGRLLIVNAMQAGLMYSYIDPQNGAPCDASKWTTFKPLSRMMRDPALQTRYEITRSQMLRDGSGNLLLDAASRANARLFRDTMGRPISAGSPLPGAYLWIDRQGRNAIFSHAPLRRTGYHAKVASMGSTEHTADTSTERFLNPDRTAGKGQSVLGAWTQGKIVHLDNALNLTDWGGRSGSTGDRYSYEMSLYDACDAQGNPIMTTVRPKPNIEVFSLENQLNHFDALNPVLPFDVVWRAQGDGQVNAEIAFDDYLRNSALIVAHMNPVIDICCGDSGGNEVACSNLTGQLRFSNGRILDGFLPTRGNWGNADDPARDTDDKLLVAPILQNAATSSQAYDAGAVTPPSHLRLRGGARVEPLNAGGVLGRGIYLDGENDFMDATYPFQSRTEWWLGVWLDARDLSTLRTVFFFPDESSIALRSDRIVAHDGPRAAAGIGGVEQHVSLQGLIEEGKFFHLGVKITTGKDRRILRFFIDGTPLAKSLVFRRFGAWLGGGGPPSEHQAGPGVVTPAKEPVGGPEGVNGPGTGGPTLDVPLGFQLMKNGQANGHTWFALGGCTTDWNPPFEGWVDELKVFSLDLAEITDATGFHEEVACNHALGTQVDLSVRAGETPDNYLGSLRSRLELHGFTHPGSGVSGKPVRAAFCEQLDLEPDGTRADLPRQHDATLLCAHRVHKNPTSDRCLRDAALGLVPLQAQSPLPDFGADAFCLGCHRADAPVFGLRLSALSPGTVAAEADPRRRPLFWPAVVTGLQRTHPFGSTTPLAGWDVCDPGMASCTALDRTFMPAGSKWHFP